VAETAADELRRIGIRLSGLAQDGLTYASNDYDVDRYRQFAELAAELLSVLSGRPAEEFFVESGEAPSAAVTREILEETGYHSSAVKLIACYGTERRPVADDVLKLAPANPIASRGRRRPWR
jgi:8-oxo-dGTP pyrophosphatase MutT (NUDIX family)